MYLWNITHTEGGNYERIATLAAEAGLTHALVKIADGPYPFNIANRVDLVPPLAAALRSNGISVWGWHYVYGASPLLEAEIAIGRVKGLKLDGYIIDAEAEYKQAGKARAASIFMQRLREGLPNTLVGLASYRYPSYHPQLPWREFRSKSDFDLPQVYWIHAHNPAAQLARSVREFSQMSPRLPYFPTGAAFKEWGWVSTPAEVLEFLKAAQIYGACNFWSWENCRKNLPKVWDTIAQYPWQGKPVPVPSPPEEVTVKTKFVALVNGQNVRSGPATSYPATGQLKAGQVLYPVHELAIVSAAEVWARFDIGWVAMTHGGTRYLRHQ
jgi:hypothetical protein